MLGAMRHFLTIAIAVGALTFPVHSEQDSQSQSFFVDETGVPTLTNRPDYYRADDRFTEKELVYDPIIIPDRYDFTSTGRIETDGDYETLIGHYSRRYNLSSHLVKAVIKAESNFDPFAVSKVGAQGLMQLMPATARRFGVTDRTDPEQNIDAGANYLRELLTLFDNDVKLAIASYNAGEGAVMKYGRTIPPYSETQQYVVRVLKYLRRNLRESRQTFNTASSVPG